MVVMDKYGVPRSTAENSYDLFADSITVVEEEPKRLLMYDWATMLGGEVLGSDRATEIIEQNALYPACGTICCESGWLGVLRGRERNGSQTPMLSVKDVPMLHDYTQDEDSTITRLGKALQDLFYTIPENDVSLPVNERLKPGTKEYVALVVYKIRKVMADFETELKAHKLEPFVIELPEEVKG